MDEAARLLQKQRRRASMQYQPRPIRDSHPRHSLFLRQLPADSMEVWKEPTFRPLLGTFSTSRSGDLASESLEKSLSERHLVTSKPRTLTQSLNFQARRMGVGLQTLAEDYRTQESSVSTAQKSEFNEDLLRKILKIRVRTAFEEADMHYDRFQGLEIRKAIKRVYAGFCQLCGLISNNSLFQTFIILLIFMNTVLLALEDPSLSVVPEPYYSMELVLLYIYTFEMGLKVVYMGLVFDKNTYLRDSWNVLDFIVVVSGWIELEYSGIGVNLSGLRALRILRPLRSITRVQGMKIVFLSLMESARMLLGSVMLLVFFYLIASIALLQMFMGALKYKCLDLDTGVMAGSWDDESICGSVACPGNQVCAPSLDNPNYGKTHFDNLFMSMLMIYQSVTLEGWFPIMTDLEKAVGRFIIIVYIPIVYLGAFFFMNMTLVAMKSSFSVVNERIKHSNSLARKTTLSSYDLDQALEAAFESPPEPQSHKSSLRPLSQSVILPPSDYFKICANAQPAGFQAGNRAANHRTRSFGSEDNLMASKEEYSLFSRELAPREVQLSSPVETEVQLSHGKSLEINQLDLSVSKSGSRILKEDPIFTETRREESESALYPNFPPEMTSLPRENAYLEENLPLSEALSPVGRPETVSSVLSPHEALMQLPFFRNKWMKAGILSDSKIAYSINENYLLNLESKLDVLQGKSQDPVGKAGPEDGFLYEEAKPEDGAVEDQPSPPCTDSLPKSFQLFLRLAARLTTKEAYLRINTLAAATIKQEMDSASLKSSWQGWEVKPNSKKVKTVGFAYRLWQSGLSGDYQRWVSPVKRLAESAGFNFAMTMCVLLNTLVLAIDHYGIESGLADSLDKCNLIFTCIFAGEMLIKMIGLGLIAYFRDKMNIFDCLIVTLSLVELAFLSSTTLSAFRSIRVFRAFRALRSARLFRSMRYMQTLIELIGKSLVNFTYMGLLLLLFIVVFSLLGMQLFGGQFDFADGKPRSNFDNFHFAFLSTFQILTMENWFNILYSAMRTSMGNASALYFIVWVFFGNYTLLNLFVAILLDSFSNASDDDDLNNSELTDLDKIGISRQNTGVKYSRKKQRKIDFIMKKIEEIKEESIESVSNSASVDTGDHSRTKKRQFVGNQCAKSYFLFRQSSKFRIFCFKVTTSSKFEWAIMGLIFASSLKLIWETYLFYEPVDSLKQQLSSYFDVVLTILFIFEFILKSISLGFAMDKGTYLRDAWNILDFVIILFSFVDLVTTGTSLSIIKVFRLLRALRPLRFISHNKSMRVIVNALMESFFALANVSIVILIVWLIFAILGVSLMKGKLYTCSNAQISTEVDCVRYGFNWRNSPHHYDNVVAAYVSLFILTSQENWPDQMYKGTDAYEEGKAMVQDYNPAMAYYFVAFMCVSNIFFLNLLLGVMFDKFEKAKKDNSSIAELLLQNEQLRWVEMMKFIIRTKRVTSPIPISTHMQTLALRLINNRYFNAFIVGCIIGNALAMAMAYAEASESYVAALERINQVFTGVFVLEACLKLYALSPSGYFADKWNCFDFFVVITSLLDLVLNLTLLQGGGNKMLTVAPQLARTLRILRVSRLFRLIKKLRMIDDLIGMMSLSIPAIANVSALLVLLFTIYGVLGAYLFHAISGKGLILDDFLNFADFGNAVLVLIRVSTGEDWNYIEYDAAQSTNFWIAVLFFQTFVSLTTFIMYNMFVMVMLQEYEAYHENPNNSFSQYKETLKKFNSAWNSAISTSNKSRMDAEMLIALALELNEGLKVDPSWSRFDIKKHLNHLGMVPDEQGFVYYHDVLFRYFRAIFKGEKVKSKIHRKLIEKEEVEYTRKIRKLVKMDKIRAMAHFMHGGEVTTGGEVPFFDLIFLKSVFRSWRNYSERPACQLDISNTPAMSVANPGANSPQDSILLPEEEGDEKQGKLRKMSQTLQRPEEPTSTTIKISRTSTNFSRPRNED